MSRADLLALTPEALASLTNLGLVKRAQRDIASGAGPALEEQTNGTILGTFEDGIVAKLPPSTPLKEAACTCGAMGVCRHRLAVALAYKPWHLAGQQEEAPSSGRADAPWSPGEIDDATLESALGTKLLERARGTMKKGLLATVERDAVPAAKLPSCTVRFLVPRDVAYARCDCALAGGACEHLALAVWAFREAKNGAGAVVVELGGSTATAPAHQDALADAMVLVRNLLVSGVGETPPSAGRFAQLRERLEHAGMTWVREIVVDLEIALDGYHKRSALYGTREITALVVELTARLRAAGGQKSELPARFVLGEDEAPETLLDHVRLVSLGARVRADERVRFADVYLADPDTKLVLVLRKRWDFEPDAEPEDGPALARRTIAARIALKALAHGQVVSKVVTRRANRSIELGLSRVAHTSVTPQRGDWDSLPAPLLVRNLEEHGARLKTRPPRLLRPRVLAEEVHVVAVSAVHDVTYSSAEQKLVAQLVDATGHGFLLVARHRRAAPHALDAIAVALTKNVRFVAGDLVRGSLQWQLDPLAVVNDDLVVPDIAGPARVHMAAGFGGHTRVDVVDAALSGGESVLEELCNVGLRNPSRGVLERAAIAAQHLDDAGLVGLAVRLRALEAAMRAGAGAASDAWMDLAVRAALGREAFHP